MAPITSTVNLLIQIAFIVGFVRGIGYVSGVKLRKHGMTTFALTLLLSASILLVMIPRFLQLYGLLSVTVFRLDFSSRLANTVAVHMVMGLITILPASYVSLDWARLRFGDDEHQGTMRMWVTALGWVLAFLWGTWLYLSLYYFV